MADINTSIEILKTGVADYEFRTTFAPGIIVEDIRQILMDIKGAKKYFIFHRD